MAVSGQIKFFYKNYGDIDNENGSATVSTGTASRNYARSRKRYLKWQSSGSDDLTTETYQLDFGSSYDVDRVIIKKHNFKAFTIKYWNGASWTHFANVVTAEGTQTNITETTNTKTTNYYEFDSVSTEKILISVDTTQTVDAEKYAYEVIASKEFGTFVGYPVYSGKFNKERASKKHFTGTVSQTIFGENFNCNLNFVTYPSESDHELIKDLWEYGKEFLIYPCGADADQYRFSDMIGNRLEDLFLVTFTGDLSPDYEKNVYQLGLNYRVSFAEVP